VLCCKVLDNTTYMSYKLQMKLLTDYLNRPIVLSDESWAHIVAGHAEITVEMIEQTLKDPVEVRESAHSLTTYLYYTIKLSAESKHRYICVAVKNTELGENYIQTAMTTSYIKNGKVVYRRED